MPGFQLTDEQKRAHEEAQDLKADRTRVKRARKSLMGQGFELGALKKHIRNVTGRRV